MRALDRLRALENSRDALDREPPKPPKGASVSFVGTAAGPFRNFEAANKPATTPAQAAELRALVARVAESWPEAERAEALAVALADPADALTSWRALAADMETPQIRARAREAGPYTSGPLAERDPADDRRTCRDCAHLSLIGRCTAARGNPNTDAGRTGFPIDDLLRRCLAYAPGPDDPDRRSGAERWPCMIADAHLRQEMATRG